MKQLNKNHRLIWMVFAIYFLFKQKTKNSSDFQIIESKSEE